MIDIKSTSGATVLSVPINEGAEARFLVMQEDCITLPFKTPSPFDFKLGYYADLAGLFDERMPLNLNKVYEVVDKQSPSYNESTGGYEYNLRLDAYYWKWKNKIFKYIPENDAHEASWDLTDPLAAHLDVFLRNLKELGYTYKGQDFTYSIQEGYGASAKLLSYSNTNMIDALSMMAEAWECEWWVIGNVIYFGRSEYGDPVDIRIGVEASKMSRSESENIYATRVYAFGSTRNIPSTYRKSLLFSVTSVEGNKITDADRPLQKSYFRKSDQIADVNIPIGMEFDMKDGYRFDGGQTVTKSFDFPVSLPGTLEAGDYRFNPNGAAVLLNVKLGTPNRKTFTMRWSFLDGETGEPIEYLSGGLYDSDSTSGNEVRFLGNWFRLEKPCGSLTFHVELTVKFGSYDDESHMYFSLLEVKDSLGETVTDEEGNPQYVLPYISDGSNAQANVSVAFQSGQLQGQTFEGTFDPKPEGGYWLSFPGISGVAQGDTFTVNNLLKGRIPDSYYTDNSSSGIVQNGVVQKRLMLPEGIPFIDAYEGMPQEEAVEAVVVFDDIYPKRIGTMSTVYTEQDAVESNGSGTEEKADFYYYTDSGLPFDDEYIIKGETLKIAFQSGIMNGMEFEVIFNPKNLPVYLDDDTLNPEAQLWKIVRNEDYGRMLPDNFIHPSQNDTYILSGFDTQMVSDLYMAEAEEELEGKAREYVEKSKKDGTFNVPLRPDWVAGVDDYSRFYYLGQRINLINPSFFGSEGRISRVIGFTVKLDIPEDYPEYVIGESKRYSRIGNLEKQLDSITFNGQNYHQTGMISQGGSVYLITRNDSTPATDMNTYSALRLLDMFLRKDMPDETRHLLKFLGGIVTDSMQSQAYTSGTLGNGFRMWVDGSGQSHVEVDELSVRMKAFFAALEVKQVTYSGGQFIFSAAGAKITRVEDIPGGNAWRCYFTADDGERAVDNLFQAGDLARVQEFNIKPGAHEGVSNTYYWGEVLGTGADYVDIATPATGRCDADSMMPKAGDDLVQLGNVSEPGRQNAILLSAVGDGSPSITQYAGITNDYTLEGKEVTRISPQGNVFQGDFRASNGQSIIEMLRGDITLAVDGAAATGRNYLKDSKGWYFTDMAKPGPAGGVQAVSQLSQDFTSAVAAHAGQSVSLSFDWRTNSAANEADAHRVVGFELTFTLAGGGNAWLHVEAQVPAHTGQLAEGHAQGSFPVPEDATGVSSALLYNRFEGAAWGANLPVAEFANIKVEWGSLPTAWTPAPEDAEGEIEDVRAELSVQAGQISSVVQEVGKVQSTIEQLPDEITLAVENVQVGGVNTFGHATPVNFYDSANNKGQLANDEKQAGGKRLIVAVGDTDHLSWIRFSECITGNGWWTVSFDVKCSYNGQTSFHVDICDRAGEATAEKEITVTGNQWTRVSCSALVDNWSADLMNFFDISGLGYMYYDIQNIKVERGNKPTDWTPCPDDTVTEGKLLATGINIRDKQIKVTADQFIVQNNAGETTAKVNADGVLETNGGIFRGDVMVYGNMRSNMVRINNANAAQYIALKPDLSAAGYELHEFLINRTGLRFTLEADFDLYNLVYLYHIPGYSNGANTAFSEDWGGSPEAYIGQTIYIRNLSAGTEIGLAGNTVSDITQGPTSISVPPGQEILMRCVLRMNQGKRDICWLREYVGPAS